MRSLQSIHNKTMPLLLPKFCHTQILVFAIAKKFIYLYVIVKVSIKSKDTVLFFRVIQ